VRRVHRRAHAAPLATLDTLCGFFYQTTPWVP
jgi:hypothetical protein